MKPCSTHSPKHLFGVSTDNVIRRDSSLPFLESLHTAIQPPDKLTMNCYRAGGAVAELLFWNAKDVIFVLTICEYKLDVSPVTDDETRVTHKVINLPDITDIMCLVVRIASHYRLQPSLSSDAESSAFVFTRAPR